MHYGTTRKIKKNAERWLIFNKRAMWKYVCDYDIFKLFNCYCLKTIIIY